MKLLIWVTSTFMAPNVTKVDMGKFAPFTSNHRNKWINVSSALSLHAALPLMRTSPLDLRRRRRKSQNGRGKGKGQFPKLDSSAVKHTVGHLCCVNKVRDAQANIWCSLGFMFICSSVLGRLTTACHHCGRRKRRRRRAPRKASDIGSSCLLRQYWKNGITFIFRWPKTSFFSIPGIPPRSQNTGMYRIIAYRWLFLFLVSF